MRENIKDYALVAGDNSWLLSSESLFLPYSELVIKLITFMQKIFKFTTRWDLVNCSKNGL